MLGRLARPGTAELFGTHGTGRPSPITVAEGRLVVRGTVRRLSTRHRGAVRGAVTGGGPARRPEDGRSEADSTGDGPGALAFLCAMPLELKPLRRRLALRDEPVGDLRLQRGRLDQRRVVAAVTGMGTARARAVCRQVLDAVAPGHVVMVGIAGALDDVTPIAALVVPELVLDAATGAAHRPAPLGPLRAGGMLWTSDAFITDPDELAALRARGVTALDMETAAVAAECASAGVAWSVVRAISDRATEPVFDNEVFARTTDEGQPDREAVARFLARHPTRVPRMVRLAADAKRAAEAAAAAAVAACAAT